MAYCPDAEDQVNNSKFMFNMKLYLAATCRLATWCSYSVDHDMTVYGTH